MSVTPYLDLVSISGQGYLAADRRRRLLFAAIIGTERSVDIVKAHDPGFEFVVLPVVTTQFLRIEFLPPVTRLRLESSRASGTLTLVRATDAGTNPENRPWKASTDSL